MREIVIDTETTGLDPYQGHRLVEVGCVELVNGIPSGQTFHRYVNPERDMPVEAFNVHGLSIEFLRDKPLFAEIADDLLEFIGDAPLVAHNALFDLGFINAELDRVSRPTVGRDRLVDTLLLARRKHPGGPNRLDDLCARYGIDNSRRTKHGALLDAEILAEVYLELMGLRQAQLVLVESGTAVSGGTGRMTAIRVRPSPLPSLVSAEEHAAHRAFVDTLGDNAIWRDYLSKEPEPDESLTAQQLPAGSVAEIAKAAVAEVLAP